MSITKKSLYSRQMILPEVGESGQRLIDDASVLVVGAGGLGSPVLTFLARAGVGKIGIVDHDQIAVTNLNRQTLFETSDVGKKKAEVARSKLLAMNPLIKIFACSQQISSENIQEIAGGYSLIVDCTDNFSTKYLLHDYAKLSQKDFVTGAIYRFEGQFQTFKFSSNKDASCLRCLTPKIPSGSCTTTCTESGVLGPVAGVIGDLMALEVLKNILGLKCEEKTSYFDLTTLDLYRVPILKSAECPLCNFSESLTSWLDKEFSSEVSIKKIKKEDWEIIRIGDVEPIYESDKRYLLVCPLGVKSAHHAREARMRGHLNVYSLFGGEAALL